MTAVVSTGRYLNMCGGKRSSIRIDNHLMHMHEYLSPLKPRYSECKWCGKRTAYSCIRCNYCYSCHPAIEYAERTGIDAA
jgi:hypothetical protein